MPLMNEATIYTAKQEAIEQLGKVKPRIIAEIAEAPEDEGPIFFRKIDTKDGFWKILYQVGSEWNLHVYCQKK